MLMRTDPFRELDRVAQQVLGTAARPAAMPIDAYRKGDEFVALFDLPGLDARSINLTVERNVLTVHAERTRPDADDVELLIGERPHGTFSRQLFLAETLDTERIAADYTDGVLQLRVPVKEQAKPRRVDIGAAALRTEVDRSQLASRPIASRSAPTQRETPERSSAVGYQPRPSHGQLARRRCPALHRQPGCADAGHATRVHSSTRHRRCRDPGPIARRATPIQPDRDRPHRRPRRPDGRRPDPRRSATNHRARERDRRPAPPARPTGERHHRHLNKTEPRRHLSSDDRDSRERVGRA